MNPDSIAPRSVASIPISNDPDRCPVQSTLAVISGRWKPLIMFHLAAGRRRFGQLAAAIPAISNRMLARQLRELEAEQLVIRTVYAEVPPRTEYELTPLGRDLDDVFAAIARWGVRYLAQQGETDDR